MRNQGQTFTPPGPLSPRRQVLASGSTEEGMCSLGQDRQGGFLGPSTFQEDRDGGGQRAGGCQGHTQGSEPGPQGPLCNGPRRAAFRVAPGPLILSLSCPSWAQPTRVSTGQRPGTSRERLWQWTRSESPPPARSVAEGMVEARLAGV